MILRVIFLTYVFFNNVYGKIYKLKTRGEICQNSAMR